MPYLSFSGQTTSSGTLPNMASRKTTSSMWSAILPAEAIVDRRGCRQPGAIRGWTLHHGGLRGAGSGYDSAGDGLRSPRTPLGGKCSTTCHANQPGTDPGGTGTFGGVPQANCRGVARLQARDEMRKDARQESTLSGELRRPFTRATCRWRKSPASRDHPDHARRLPDRRTHLRSDVIDRLTIALGYELSRAELRRIVTAASTVPPLSTLEHLALAADRTGRSAFARGWAGQIANTGIELQPRSFNACLIIGDPSVQSANMGPPRWL